MRRLWITIIAIWALLVSLYLARRRLISKLFHLPPAGYRITVRHDLRIPMRDGILLAADLYQPRTETLMPTILIRSPYGRNGYQNAFGILLAFAARRFAERGYNVLVQDTRGRCDSGGEFNPNFDERNDGLDTEAWLKQQPWFNGVLGLWGPSYLGIVQWAIAGEAESVRAMVPSITSSRLMDVLFPDGAFDLGLALRWLALFQALDRNDHRPLIASAPMLWQVERAIEPAFKHLPVMEGDQVALGEPRSYYRKWLQRTPEEETAFQVALAEMNPARVTAPVHLMGGWYDFFLNAQLRDFETLKRAGRNPYLTIGPWQHFSNAMIMSDSLQIGINWFDAHLKGQRDKLPREPVQLYVMGVNQWREFDSWPPPADELHYYLHERGELSPDLPGDESPDRYRYDPHDPTPAVGGAQFNPWGGPKDNRRLEARPDVLTYTTPRLSVPLEIIGPVRLALYARSSLAHTDFFGRLCDVYPDGRSINICDGLFRVAPGKIKRNVGDIWCVEIDMWATAYRFRAGHRVRLQVSSGAHPHWSRNLGTGDDLGVEARCADQTIYHDRLHPSRLILPGVRSE